MHFCLSFIHTHTRIYTQRYEYLFIFATIYRTFLKIKQIKFIVINTENTNLMSLVLDETSEAARVG